ncbi:hypothetical protein [Bacillus paramycoides]|uniref:hypothetical protein n=1 Tax=Bacillus paramycoides TaxID=2026194 RepID=UPI002E206380|nr:hypothetical protein [Bacillus paramycoides]
MRKETAVQVQSEIKMVESEIHKLQYHLIGLDSEKRKTKRALEELKNRKEKLKSYKIVIWGNCDYANVFQPFQRQ